MFKLSDLSCKNALLSSASLVAILFTQSAQAATLAGLTGRTATQIVGTAAPKPPAGFGGVTTPGQATTATQQSSKDFSTALAAIQNQLSAQATARNAALAGPNNLGADPNHPGQQLPNVPDGLAAGGLVPHASANPTPTDVANGLVWENANAPTQTTSGAKTTVTIQQTAQKAILTWDTFNVGKNTTVHFDQTAGTQADGSNTWIALNRVIDPTDRPSQILGNIQAEGTVYLINRNGIIFGGSSQVNVHSLIASALPIFAFDPNNHANGTGDNLVDANNIFLTQGLEGADTTGSVQFGGAYDPAHPFGDIVIQAGADIATGDSGSSLIAGQNVTNAGAVTAVNGQVTLAAGVGLNIQPPSSNSNGLSPVLLSGQGTVSLLPSGSYSDNTPQGMVINSGLIGSTRGSATLLGYGVTQSGTLFATTSITRPGSIAINASDGLVLRQGPLTFTSGSLTAILPDGDDETTTSTTAADAAFTAGSISLLGGSTTLQNGSLIEAPGATVTIGSLIQGRQATDVNGVLDATGVMGRLFIDNGATVDVAGMTDVQLPVSVNAVNVARVGQNELADSPVQQNGFLYTKSITVDARDSGVRADGESWVGTPLADVSGYVDLVPRKVDQMLVNGGTINLAGGEVITMPGSMLNLQGGYVHYLGGVVQTTRLIGADGNVYSIDNADPNMTYTGFAGLDTVNHDRWVITDTYTNSLISGALGQYETDYIQGGNGGHLAIFAGGLDSAINPLGSIGFAALNGTILAQTYAGRLQVADADAPTAGSFEIGNVSRGGTPLSFFIEPNTTSAPVTEISYVVGAQGPDLGALAPGFNADTAIGNLPALLAMSPTDTNNLLFTSPLSADMLNKAGFQSISILGHAGLINVNPGIKVAVTPGGSINLTAASIGIYGTLSAPSGSITLTVDGAGGLWIGALNADPSKPFTPQPFGITLGPDAILSTRGLWVNDEFLDEDERTGSEFINGGSISLSTTAISLVNSGNVVGDTTTTTTTDLTGSIDLQQGSVLDVSSGGYVEPNGQILTKNGVVQGNAGSILLQTYDGPGFNGQQTSPPLPGTSVVSPDPANPGQTTTTVTPTLITGGQVHMDGTVLSDGFSGGGTFNLKVPQIQIGGDAVGLPSYVTYLSPAFFNSQGFGSYNLNAIYSTTVAAGTILAPREMNFLPDLKTAAQAATGSDVYGFNQIGRLDDYHRQAVNLSLASGYNFNWTSGALGDTAYPGVTGTLLVDNGAAIMADAGAAITITSPDQITILGELSAPGGTITLSGTATTVTAGAAAAALNGTQSVWLGSNSVLDVSGVSLIDDQAPFVLSQSGLIQPHTGKVLDGGTVSILDGFGYVIAEKGAVINVSGASDTYDIQQTAGGGLMQRAVYAPTLVWSDAGSVTLGATSGLLFDGTLLAHGGAAQARGGSLTIDALGASPVLFSAPGSTGILVQQSVIDVPAGLTPGARVETGPVSGLLHFSTDTLTGSGIDNLTLQAQSQTSAILPASATIIGFAGDVKIDLPGSFIADATSFIALPAVATAITAPVNHQASSGEGTVDIAASYVNLVGYGPSGVASVFAAGDATLNVTGGTIDLSGVFGLQNFANANFTSAGDIRLYTIGLATLAAGKMTTAGNVTLKATQVYPSTANSFIIDADADGIADIDGTPRVTTVTILPNGSSSVPLSAGGSLLIDANVIDQEGTLRAPGGQIVLGVNDTASQAALFGGLPVTGTQSLTLGDGSVTSVSLEGATIPYGTTIDGKEWQLQIAGLINTTFADLTAPPTKSINLNADSIGLDKGASVNISGGGDLQAQEWVPGTGGSRNVLAQQNTVYSSGATPTTVPLYSDNRPVYAVIPGVSGLAPYDPTYSSTNTLIGQKVYLSGVPGLPAGTYTLLPAQYATQAGAFRVVQNTGVVDAVAGNNNTLADGTSNVAGYFVDGLTGARDSRTTSFTVQSRNVWSKYSEYDYTSANTFFPALATHAGDAVPRLPVDAGHLSLGANDSLILGATIDSAAGAGGRGGEIDIASGNIQITDGAAPTLDGYLTVNVDDLSALGAASLLIGGQRSDTASGQTIAVQSQNIVVDTSADHPLSAPELILAAQNDITVDAGSAIAAKGDIAASSDEPLAIGQLASGSAPAISGDGALLRVSNGAPVAITRTNVTGLDGPAGTAGGALTIQAGASIDGGSSLMFDATGNTTIDKTASFTAHAISVNSNRISFLADDSSASPSGLVVGPNTLALFANATTVDLHSRSSIDFFGDVSVNLGNALTLGAGAFISDGGNVTISAPDVTFVNDLGAPVPAATDGAGTLTVNAGQVNFGTGDKVLQGFHSVAFNATAGMLGQGQGSFDFGDVPVTLTTPVLIADQLAQSTLKTTGALTVNAAGGTPLPLSPLGGAITLIGGTLNQNANILANGGTVTLEATSGDLTLGDKAVIAVNGIGKAFYDVTAYAPAGAINLTADTGNIIVPGGATLDFSAPDGGGNAGSLSVVAPIQTALLNGTLKGGAKNGIGGSFDLDIGGAVDLDSLAGVLASSGIDNALTIRTRQGNLILSAGNSLTAQNVSLTADGGTTPSDSANGHVLIAGTINASGAAGGDIALYGKSGVDVEGTLNAVGTSADERGGNIILGTGGNADGSYNTNYGYELIDAADSGSIVIGPHAALHVDGGTKAGLSGGTIEIRAPLLSNGDVNVSIDPNATVTGARDVGLEAYVVWSTTDATTGAQHFDGLIDPAGWYNADGTMVAGNWTDQAGNPLAAPTADQLATYLSQDYFTVAAPNADHQSFYGYVNGDPTQGAGALMGFVQAPGFVFENRFANIANFHARPGIELDNPDPNINGGAISVLTNWNLGAGTANHDATIDYTFRYGDQAPILTLRSEGDIKVKASISDGFYAYALNNSFFVGGIPFNDAVQYLEANAINDFLPTGGFFSDDQNNNLYFPSWLAAQPATPHELGISGTQDGYYLVYEDYINTYINFLSNTLFTFGNAGASTLAASSETPAPGAPVAPQFTGTTLADYENYLTLYNQYANVNYPNYGFSAGAMLALPTPPAPPPLVSQPPPPGDNSVSPVATPTNPAPLAIASLAPTTTLIGGTSSYRLVAGADFAATDPMAVRAGATGDVILDGHFTLQDINNTQVPLPQFISVPTMIRTGAGSISIAAANDLQMIDTAAPGVIYAAGVPDTDAPMETNNSLLQQQQGGAGRPPEVFISGLVSPTGAGDISIHAGRDIDGGQFLLPSGGTIPASSDQVFIGQTWWQWLQTSVPEGMVASPTGNFTNIATSLGINFGGFDQGVLSVGGNVDVTAGRDIRDFAVSLPTTWYLSGDMSNPTVNTVGGGNLNVTAGRDILSGNYFVAKGTGTITAGGQIGSDFQYSEPSLAVPAYQSAGNPTTDVATLLALQDATLNVSARQTVNIGQVYDPSYFAAETLSGSPTVFPTDGTPFSADSALNIVSTGGDILFDTLRIHQALFGSLYMGGRAPMLPASLNLTSLSGAIGIDGSGEMYPSATGQLNLLANNSVTFYNDKFDLGADASNGGGFNFGMIDLPVSSLPSVLNPGFTGNTDYLAGTVPFDHSPILLHATDDEPVRIYSLTGNVVNGLTDPSGESMDGLALWFDKPAQIYAANDIVNLWMYGQNLDPSGVTRISAGHDIYDQPIGLGGTGSAGQDYGFLPVIEIGGPGTLLVEAGRDLGHLTSVSELVNISPITEGDGRYDTGIQAVGDLYDGYLPHQSASVDVLFGVGPGIATEDFASTYLDPTSAAAGLPSFAPDLVSFMQQYDNGQWKKAGKSGNAPTLNVNQAWVEFQTLPDWRQLLLEQQVLFNIFQTVGTDYNDPSSAFFHQYARGYDAINALFPASLGYTQNALEGGSNGANSPVSTGNLDIRSSTIQTREGGDISILGPGGSILVGSSSAPPYFTNAQGSVLAGPDQSGILTLESGSINVFSDQSLQLAQSRVFTEQGGAITMWSSNGDINAGKGAKTTSETPQPSYVCNPDGYCRVDPKGQVSGAGIGSLQTIPDAPTGNVFLIAPRGTVDAGDAGIRVSGDLFVAALAVANADNIQVQGKSFGLPPTPVTNLTLTTASTAATEAAAITQNLARQQPATQVDVEVIGYGQGDFDNPQECRATNANDCAKH